MAENVKKGGFGKVLFWIILIGFIIYGIGSCGDNEGSDNSKSNYVSLNAKITTVGTGDIVLGMTIYNNDIFDYENVRVTVNEKYVVKIPLIPAGKSYYVGSLTFTDDNGIRYNPYKMKLLKVWVLCTVHKDGKEQEGFINFVNE